MCELIEELCARDPEMVRWPGLLGEDDQCAFMVGCVLDDLEEVGERARERSRELREYFEPRDERLRAENERLRDALECLNRGKVWPEPACRAVAHLGVSLEEMSRRENETARKNAELWEANEEFEHKTRARLFSVLCNPCLNAWKARYDSD